MTRLSAYTDYNLKIACLKSCYPAVYMAYCFYQRSYSHIKAYVEESLNLKNAGPLEYSQYLHGGVIPSLRLGKNEHPSFDSNTPKAKLPFTFPEAGQEHTMLELNQGSRNLVADLGDSSNSIRSKYAPVFI